MKTNHICQPVLYHPGVRDGGGEPERLGVHDCALPGFMSVDYSPQQLLAFLGLLPSSSSR